MPRFLLIRSMMLAVLLVTCGHLSAQVQEEAEDIRPPKALVEIPQPKKAPVALWTGIGGGLLALLISTLLWKRHARRQKLKSPPEVALASLTELERTREALTAEAFANRAAQAVRQYIADRFGLAAPRRTTEEFLRDVEKSPLIGESDHLRAFLKSCDLAKFAGSNLDSAQRGELLQTARGFVNATAKPQVVQP
jgi:hypothetical protein